MLFLESLFNWSLFFSSFSFSLAFTTVGGLPACTCHIRRISVGTDPSCLLSHLVGYGLWVWSALNGTSRRWVKLLPLLYTCSRFSRTWNIRLETFWTMAVVPEFCLLKVGYEFVSLFKTSGLSSSCGLAVTGTGWLLAPAALSLRHGCLSFFLPRGFPDWLG